MHRILALINFSDVTPVLLGVACDLGRATGSELILMHVAMPDAEFVGDEPRPDVSRKGISRELRHHHRELEILALELKKQGVNARSLMVQGNSPRGNPVPKILAEAERLSPDLILLGSRRRGWLYRLLVGTVSDALTRRAHRPVLLVPHRVACHSEGGRGVTAPDAAEARAGRTG